MSNRRTGNNKRKHVAMSEQHPETVRFENLPFQK